MTAICPACDAADLAVEIAEKPLQLTLSVPGIKCAACIGAIEGKLAATPGVREARVNLTLKRVSIATSNAAEEMVAALKDVGFDAYPFDPEAISAETDPITRDLTLRTGIAGFAMMNIMLLSVAVWSGATDATRDLFHLVSAVIAVPTVLYCGQPFFRSAWGAVRHLRTNMDVPISLGILLATGASLYEALNSGHHAYFDAAVSLTLFLLVGRLLEHKTRATARSAAKDLSALEVHTAQRLQNGTVETVRATELGVGDEILVPSGVRVPADGTLSSPSATTDLSFLTGESEPVTHVRGAPLQAGEINLAAPFEMRATAVGADTRLRQMAHLVETAENVRNRYTSVADRVARFYAPVVHLLAAVTFVGWYAATGDLRHSLMIAIAVLIITCPCALALAVPAVSTAAIGRLYRLGFLVKSGTALERLADADTVVLDKTGTLTQPGFDFDTTGLDPNDCRIAKALAQSSSHPLARALNAHLGDATAADLSNVTEIAGEGVVATTGDKSVRLGKPAHDANALALTIGGRTQLLSYSETLRPGADGLGSAFDRMGLTPEVLSGDTEAKTHAIAQRLGIARAWARSTPEEKHAHILHANDSGHTPVMIGDGINDTAALQAAHASVAPGTALDAARSAADVVMLGQSLEDLPQLFATARKAVRLYKQNFVIAALYNTCAVPLAIAGYATPLLAAIAMSTSSIIVLLNATRARTAS